ncbi:hypothetical protein H5T58_00765, partial [Candidatus Parcubacteria bacterium]|nr:hypothetical protein [Candidatus Parcubacteria bacterium]
NPKVKKDNWTECFCFEPNNIYEGKLGPLYFVGNLKSPVLWGENFLKELAFFIKENFYKKSALSPQRAFKESLKEANEFLERKLREGNSHWLGNLDVFVLNVKNEKIIFSIGGKMAIQLLRGGKIFDLEKKAKIDKISHTAQNFFKNIISGKLLKNDCLLVENEEIFEIFEKLKIFEEIKGKVPFRAHFLKKLILDNKENFQKAGGICFVLDYSATEKELKTFSFSSEKEKNFSLIFALKQFFTKENLKNLYWKIKNTSPFNQRWFWLFLIFLLLCLLYYCLF